MASAYAMLPSASCASATVDKLERVNGSAIYLTAERRIGAVNEIVRGRTGVVGVPRPERAVKRGGQDGPRCNRKSS